MLFFLSRFTIRCHELLDHMAWTRAAKAAMGGATRAFRLIGGSTLFIRGSSSREDHVSIFVGAVVSVTRCGTAARTTRVVGRRCLWHHKIGTRSASLQGCVNRSFRDVDGSICLIIKLLVFPR
ncbi:hypothetical protein TRVL_03021 [Trypanosoma vivax]|nr:hypothetical protein TRVL_03021 [Trypanosoma vivax]